MRLAGISRRPPTDPPRPRLVDAARTAGRFVWRSSRRDFTISLVAEAVGALGLAGVLLFGQQLATRLTADVPVDELADVLPATIGLGLSLAVSGLATVVVRRYRWLVAEDVARHVADEIIEVSTSVPYERFEQQEFHDLLDRADAQASESSYQLVYDFLSVVNLAVTSVVVVLVLVRTVPEVLGALVLIAVPSIVAARVSARLAFQATYELTPDDRLRFSLYGALTGRSEAREIRVFGTGPVLRRRWDGLYDERMDRIRALVRRQVLFDGIASLVGAALVAGVLLVLVRATVDGRITVADAAIAIVALQQLTMRLRSASSASGSLRQATLFLDDFERFRSLGAVAPDGTADPVAPMPQATLAVEHVSFRYPGTHPLVLDDVSLELAPGEVVALVGVSGSGKTTLAHLVARLYEPTSGRITYGGVDLADMAVDSYWRSVAVVFQDFVRYELTARENIAMSDHARMDDLEGITGAATRAGIDPALRRLPAGYETMMSRSYEGGADLSVGQWQRVAVARAFFRDAPLLILDEPAAALDAVAEQQLYERMVELSASRSVLLISHRFSTVRMADRICVMDEGRIAEQGTHDELMALGGRYAHLFGLQASGYLGNRVAAPPTDGGHP